MTRPRRTFHSKKEKKPAPQRLARPAPPKKKAVAVVGKAYSIEELQVLIAALSSGSSDREIKGIEEFAENQGAISETAANTPDVSGTEIMELVIAAAMANERQMLKRFEKEGKTKALSFLAKSASIPPKIQEKAKIILQRIEPQALKAPEEEKGPALIEMPYTPKEVKLLLRDFSSKVKDIKIDAAIRFIKDYPRIAPTVAEIPMLTVTQVTTKAVEVIKQNTDVVIDTMVKKRMRPALLFLASLAQVPLDIRKKAQEAVEKLEPMVPALAPKKEKAAKPGEFRADELELQKAYSPFELEALLSGLGSVERVRVVKTCVEFLKNYDMIVKAISKAPMLTVTEVTAKAVKAIESNLDGVLKELMGRRENQALEFLAHSSKFSMQTRKKASLLLKKLMPPASEEEK